MKQLNFCICTIQILHFIELVINAFYFDMENNVFNFFLLSNFTFRNFSLIIRWKKKEKSQLYNNRNYIQTEC